MRKLIHRVVLEITDEQVADLPGFIRPLHVAQARPYPRGVGNAPGPYLELWYEVEATRDGDLEPRDVTVWVEGTGHLFDHHGDYVGTFPTDDGRLIWHVYIAPNDGIAR